MILEKWSITYLSQCIQQDVSANLSRLSVKRKNENRNPGPTPLISPTGRTLGWPSYNNS